MSDRDEQALAAFVRARALADEACAIARREPDESLQRMPLHLQAAAARMGGDFALARLLYHESIQLNQRLGAERMVPAEHHNLGYVELHDGQLARVKEFWAAALADARRLGYEGLFPLLVIDAAVLAAERGAPENAARLLASGIAAITQTGDVPDLPRWAATSIAADPEVHRWIVGA